MKALNLAALVLLAASGSAAAGAAPAAAAAQGGAAAQAGADPAAGYHVVELENSETVSAEKLLAVLTDKLGATKEKAMAVIERVEAKGKAVVVAGAKESCTEAAELFVGIGMKAEVRPLRAEDMPSEYDDSDVIVAGPARLQELIEADHAGLLVVFFAPWYGRLPQLLPQPPLKSPLSASSSPPAHPPPLPLRLSLIAGAARASR